MGASLGFCLTPLCLFLITFEALSDAKLLFARKKISRGGAPGDHFLVSVGRWKVTPSGLNSRKRRYNEDLLATTRAIRTTSFKERFLRLRSFMPTIYCKTLLMSHVEVYFGFGGRLL